MTYKHDCAGLRREYELAERTQEGDIMVYVDEHADEAGCCPNGVRNFHEGG